MQLVSKNLINFHSIICPPILFNFTCLGLAGPGPKSRDFFNLGRQKKWLLKFAHPLFINNSNLNNAKQGLQNYDVKFCSF